MAVPVLAIDPLSTSFWVVVYEAVQVSMAGGQRRTAQVRADRPGCGSVTVTYVSVTLPVLETT